MTLSRKKCIQPDLLLIVPAIHLFLIAKWQSMISFGVLSISPTVVEHCFWMIIIAMCLETIRQRCHDERMLALVTFAMFVGIHLLV
jgi:hypothetical protein